MYIIVKDIEGLKKFKPADWSPSTVTSVFSNKNVGQKKWWWPTLNASNLYREELAAWTDPRPKAPKTSQSKKAASKEESNKKTLTDGKNGLQETKKRKMVAKCTKAEKKSKISGKENISVNAQLGKVFSPRSTFQNMSF